MENQKDKGILERTYDWFKNLTVKGLLGAILLVFVLVVILMSVSYLPGVISRVSSSLSAALYSVFVPAEGATMTANRMIMNSGEDFVITFKRGEATDGLFAVSYSCDITAELMAVESAGLKKIDCDTKYYLLDNDTSIKIRVNTNDSVVRLLVEGAFEDNASQKTETIGVVRITVKNDSVGNIIPAVKPAVTTTAPTTVTPAPAVSQPSYVAPLVPTTYYYGKPDLAVRMLQVGLLTGSNYITSQNQFSYQDMVGIKFEVRNDGDTVTGPWSFTATMPSISTPTYNSPTQVSLKPGDSIIFTLGFNALTNTYSNNITVQVDPYNQVSESSESNNTIISTIFNSSYNSNYYNNNYNNNYNNTTGCYINGIFTYNCYNNNYNYNYNNGWDYNYNYNNLRVSCYADDSNPNTGDRVRWYAEVDGGDGNYDYDWTGTNGLDSTSKNPTKTYSSTGTKRATLTVTDGDNNEASATCTVYVD